MNAAAHKVSSMEPEEVRALYRKVFGGVDGQLVLEDLKLRCFVYVPTMAYAEQGGIDLARMAYNEGARGIILSIETQMEPETNEEGN